MQNVIAMMLVADGCKAIALWFVRCSESFFFRALLCGYRVFLKVDR